MRVVQKIKKKKKVDGTIILLSTNPLVAITLIASVTEGLEFDFMLD